MNKIYYFKPTDDFKYIQGKCDKIYARLFNGQFSKERVVLAFYPGFYDIKIKVGFFMEVIGLGLKPEDTIINNIMVEATFLPYHNALCNFDRMISNLTIDSDCIFAVSQAASMRKVIINGNLYLSDNNGAGSGGCLVSCIIKGKIYSGPQQQYFLRDCIFADFDNDNWNMVFVNCPNAPTVSWPIKQFTSVHDIKRKDKPQLVSKDNRLYISYNDNLISIDKFYIPNDKDDDINIQTSLDNGYHLLFIANHFHFKKPLIVNNDNVFILGLGFPTLYPDNPDGILIINGNNCVISGLLFEAVDSSFHLIVNGNNNNLYDIYSRIGGHSNVKTHVETSIIINGNNCFSENYWLWRADHSYGVGIDINVANHGIIVNGNDNVFYALMVEHFLKYQTIFNGNNCKTIMYQSETPYEFTSQDQYKNGNVNGYSSYKVADNVDKHVAVGLGIYSVFLKAPLWLDMAIETPLKKDIYFKHLVILELGPNRGIHHVINDIEGISKNKIMRYVLEYPKKLLVAKVNATIKHIFEV